MNVTVVFLQGSLSGRTVTVPPGGTVSVGRSHTCDVRATEADVSSRHVVFSRASGSALAVEVVSARRTLFNGNTVRQGDILPLRPGDTLTLGASLSCRIEGGAEAERRPSESSSSSLPTVPPAQRESVTRVPRPDSAPQVSAGGEMRQDRQETVAIKTRLASDEELDAIRDEDRRRRSRRTLLLLVPIVAFVAVAVALYVALRPKTEVMVTWPTDASGSFLNHAIQVADYLGLIVPDVPEFRVVRTETGQEVWTRTGLRRDVPLHVDVQAEKSLSFLEVGREKAFEKWLHARRLSDPSFNPSVERRRIWTNRKTGNGALFNSVSYVRRIGEDDWYGYVLFTRFEDVQHALFIEVPLRERHRAESFLTSYLPNFCIYATRRVPVLWEGADGWRAATSVRQDLDEAESYLRNKAPALWEKAWYLLRSGLIKAKKAGDEKALQDGRRLLRQLRDDQGTWYATQKLAWEYAVRDGRKGDAQAVQALGESIFSSEFKDSDCRYDSIKRKDWK